LDRLDRLDKLDKLDKVGFLEGVGYWTSWKG
jgi:hypothetical protein